LNRYKGVGGLDKELPVFSEKPAKLTTVLILMQSGFGRSCFAHQYHDIKPDIICWQKVWVTVFQLVVF
jgi:acetylornithine aminotransferase